MKNINFECTVKSTEVKKKQTADVDSETAVIVLETKDGEKITIKGEVELLDGIKPKAKCTISLRNPQETLK